MIICNLSLGRVADAHTGVRRYISNQILRAKAASYYGWSIAARGG